MGPGKGLALLLSPSKGEESERESKPDLETSDYDDALADVAEILGVPKEKREELGLALQRLIMSCGDGHEEEG